MKLSCPACSAENPAGRKSCGACGVPLAAACPADRAPANPEDLFCIQPGSPLAGEAAPLANLEQLGFLQEMEETFQKILRSPYGIILIAGPPGSGKTTTLRVALRAAGSRGGNCIPLEDPAERPLGGTARTPANPPAGLTLASGLRASLRRGPEAILAGEIRDLETAETAVHAALTGHLVIGTLLSHDAPESIALLGDLGIEPFLVSTSLAGALAQRLVRRICRGCRIAVPIDGPAGRQLGIDPVPPDARIFRGKGCSECNGSGYCGQLGLYELLPIEDRLRSLIAESAPAAALRRESRKMGLRTLREDGVLKALQGMTSLEEVLRVTAPERP